MTSSPWLPDLPDGWKVARLQHLATTATSNVDKHSIAGQEPVRLCNYVDVYRNDDIHSDMDFMAATATTEQIERFTLRRGDVIITKDSETSDDIGIPAFVDYEAPDLVCGYHLSMIRPLRETTDPRFLYWVLASNVALNQWSVLATGVTRVGLKTGDIARLQVPLPPLSEQRAIADYLDRETAQIDTLIDEQQAFRELRAERRGAVLARVFGAPPTHSLRRAIDFAQTGPFGTQLSSEEYVTGGVPVVNPSHIVANRISPDAAVSVTTEKADDLKRHRVRVGDLLLGRKGEVDKAALIDAESQGFICGSDSMLLRPSRDTDPNYLWWFLQSPTAHHQLAYWSVGATVAGLNQNTISKVMLPLPDVATQRQTVVELERAIQAIDHLESETATMQELARERRAALITAAVTGQIDVGTAA